MFELKSRMKRESLILLLLLVLPGIANALGLDKLELISGLNQPFEARIRLLSPTRDDLDSLRVNLADMEAFRRAGIDRPLFLAKLKFQVEETPDGDYITISSSEPVREPYLNFLIEAEWSKGRLFREYTVLLDPPLYDPSTKHAQMPASTKPEVSSIREPVSSSPTSSREVFEPEIEPAAATPEPIAQAVVEADNGPVIEQMGEQEVEIAQVVDGGVDEQIAEPAPVYNRFGGNEYGPAEYGDTLWSIARDWRADSSVTIQQMMLALLRTNPEAFIDNNINGLKRGYILRMPDSDELTALTDEQALNEVKSQYAVWDETRGNIASVTPDRPVTADLESGSISGGEETAAEEDQSELRLVAASEQGTTVDLGGGEETGADAGVTSESLALANEQLEAISQENIELKERLTEAESIIEDLKRLVVLKDDELASIQQQMEMNADEVQAGEEETGAVEEETGPAAAGGSPGESETESAKQAEEKAPAATDEKQAAADEAVKKVPAQPPVDEQSMASTGMLDQIIATIMDNLVIIGGALAAVLIAVVSLRVISRRKSAGAGETVEEVADLADFTGDEDVTEVQADESLEDLLGPAAAPESGSDTETELAMAIGGEVDDTAQVEMTESMFSYEEPRVEEEEDPLAEVNVFLAYEHFEQAEEFVRDAIKRNPDNLDYHSKLLEVFYAAGNKKAYEEAARVLYHKVNGAGEYWDMAQAMWQEISPNRALFAAGDGEGEEDVTAGGHGMLDITAVSGDETDHAQSGLDFDLGQDGKDDSASTVSSATSNRGDILNVTADGDEEILDVTSATNGGSTPDDLLDVTAAVGLDTIESGQDFSMTDQEQQLLEMTSGGAGDLLESSLGGGEDLLDITAHANLESDGIEEDLLDVTAATSVGADVNGLMDLDINEEVAGNDIGENSVEFDLGGTGEASADDNVIDFDTSSLGQGGAENEGLDFNLSEESLGGEEEGEGGAELDLSMNFGEDEGNELEFSLDTSDEEADSGEQTLVLDNENIEVGPAGEEPELQGVDDTLELDMGDGLIDQEQEADEQDGGLEVDLSIEDYDDSASIDEEAVSLNMDDMEDDSGVNFDLTVMDEELEDAEMEKTVEVSANEIEAALEEAEDIDAGEIDIGDLELDSGLEDSDDSEMSSTFEMPQLDEEPGDEGGAQTVFVPSSSNSQEDDEIATKLDLAKAYVELGDNDSAKSILDEVIADGNDEQRQQARELMGEI